MSMSIFYYTSNFICPKLLEATLKLAIQRAKENNVRLVITSHYPLINDYEEVDMDTSDIIFRHTKKVPEELKKFIVKDLRISTDGADVKNYVFPTLPYSVGSIIKQLLYSCEVCGTDKLILFEHDCFYPEKYVKVVEKVLDDVSMTFCVEKYVMLNKMGFYNCDPHIFLSSFGSKVEKFREVFENKLKLFKEKQGDFVVLEPIVPWDIVLDEVLNEEGLISKKMLRLKTEETKHLEIKGNLVNKCKGEIIIEDSFCIDDLLGENNCILELQHGLNTSPSLPFMRKLCDKMTKKYNTPFKEHPLWGNAKQYIDCIEIEDSKAANLASEIGLHHLGIGK